LGDDDLDEPQHPAAKPHDDHGGASYDLSAESGLKAGRERETDRKGLREDASDRTKP
jgi:hypothetical protein